MRGMGVSVSVLTIDWTAIGRSDRLFYYYTQPENLKHFE